MKPLNAMRTAFIIAALFIVSAAAAMTSETTVTDFRTDSLVPHFRYHRRASPSHSASSSTSAASDEEKMVDGSGQAAEERQLNPVQLPVRATRDAAEAADDITSDASGQEPAAASIAHAQVKRHVEAVENGSGELP